VRRFLLTLVAFFIVKSGIFWGQTSAATQQIQVLLLDYRTGQPLKGRYVALSLSNADGKFLRADAIRGKTDANGVVVFELSATPPPKVGVAVDDYACAEHEEFATADILQHGIAGSYVDDNRCKPHVSLLPDAIPGQVVFPVHRLNLWQRFWRALE
jgi:hypothetical protein